MPDNIQYTVAVLAPNGVVASDLSAPLDVLGRATVQGKPCYSLRVCAESTPVESEHFTINAPFTLRSMGSATTIIVAGVHDPETASTPAIKRALLRAYHRGARIASICTGAFLLAEAGILDGKGATTHWLATGRLAELYPDIDVDPNVLFVDNGQVLTSAGAVAGIDLCLHLIALDFGPAIAAQSAKKSVVPLARAGGQAQFIDQQIAARDYGSLEPLLVWIEKNLSQSLEVEALADRAALSARTLHRRFVAQTGLPPNAWVVRCRVRAAQQLLETITMSLEQVADATGFGSRQNFRARFSEVVGLSPSGYRSAFTSNA